MLMHLKLDNFKIWRSTGAMRLAPLTLLLGTNSSGKSSLIQSLLLIRQTVIGSDPNIDLNLGNPDEGDSVTLGQFKDVLCRHGSSTPSTPVNQISIEFRWHDPTTNISSAIFNARYRSGSSGSADLDYLRMGVGEQGYIVQRRKPGVYSLQLSNERKPLGQSEDFHPQRSFAFSAAALAKLGTAAKQVSPIGPALLDELAKIIYLGPVRKLAQRDYVWSGRLPSHIGDDGSKAIDALIASGVAHQKTGRKSQPVLDEAELFKQTIYWLKEMNLADGLAVKSLGNSARYELLIENYGEYSNIKDVGVGVSQVLPVIVAALYAKPGHIVIIEEPESHLHPLAQSVLANLMAKISKHRKVQFIVETHSEHLFRRMQTLIARQELLPEDSALYFVEREGNLAKLIELEVDEFGKIRNWPQAFFGDSMGETREQARLAIQRAKELREKNGNLPN